MFFLCIFYHFWLGWCVTAFMFHWHLRFNSYPSLLNIFNVFIKKLSEMFFFCPFEGCGQEISVGLVFSAIKFFKLLVFIFYKFWVYIVFYLIEFCKLCVVHGLVRSFSSLFLSFLSGACVSNRLSILDRYWFIDKLTSLFPLNKICSQSVWLKSEISLLLSDFLQSYLNILDFVAGIFEKKYFKKVNCGWWSKNIDVILPDSISAKEVEFEKMLSINVEVLEILVRKSIWGKSSFGRLFCSITNNGEIKSFLKLFNMKCRMFIYVTYNHISWFWADSLYKSWFNFFWMMEP